MVQEGGGLIKIPLSNKTVSLEVEHGGGGRGLIEIPLGNKTVIFRSLMQTLGSQCQLKLCNPITSRKGRQR